MCLSYIDLNQNFILFFLHLKLNKIVFLKIFTYKQIKYCEHKNFYLSSQLSTFG